MGVGFFVRFGVGLVWHGMMSLEKASAMRGLFLSAPISSVSE